MRTHAIPRDDPAALRRLLLRLAGDDEVLRRIYDARWLLRLADAGELDGDDSRPVAAAILAEAEAEWSWRRRRDLHKPATPTGYPVALLCGIKARINLVHLIQNDGYALHRAGATWRGPCPWHDGRSGASFTVFAPTRTTSTSTASAAARPATPSTGSRRSAA